MSQTINVPKNEFDNLVSSVKRIEKLLLLLLDEEYTAKEHKANYKYEEGEPEYGSKDWWKWADNKGTLAVREGKAKSFKSGKDIENYLESLK